MSTAWLQHITGFKILKTYFAGTVETGPELSKYCKNGRIIVALDRWNQKSDSRDKHTSDLKKTWEQKIVATFLDAASTHPEDQAIIHLGIIPVSGQDFGYSKTLEIQKIWIRYTGTHVHMSNLAWELYTLLSQTCFSSQKLTCFQKHNQITF